MFCIYLQARGAGGETKPQNVGSEKIKIKMRTIERAFGGGTKTDWQTAGSSSFVVFFTLCRMTWCRYSMIATFLWTNRFIFFVTKWNTVDISNMFAYYFSLSSHVSKLITIKRTVSRFSRNKLMKNPEILLFSFLNHRGAHRDVFTLFFFSSL